MSEVKPVLHDKRCTNCNALLFKAVIEVGKVEVKCRECGIYNTIEAQRKYGQIQTCPVKH